MSIVNATVEGNDNIISIDDTATTEQQAVIKFVNTQEDAKKFVVEKVSKEDETIKYNYHCITKYPCGLYDDSIGLYFGLL